MIVQSEPMISSTDTPTAETWVEDTHHFTFRLGEFGLFTKHFPALVLDTHHTKLTTDLDNPRPPIERLSPQLEAIVIPWHPVEKDLPLLTKSATAIRYVPAHYNDFCVEITGTHSDYLQRLSKKHRHELARKVKKFRKFAGDRLTFREYRRSDEMEEFHTLALSVSERTYQERLLQVGLPKDDEFRRETEKLAASDAIRAYILSFEDRPIAYAFCCAKQDALIYETTGYDPDFRQWSPGLVLLAFMLENLFTEGRFSLLDFGGGDAQWKRSYGNIQTRCADIYYFRPTMRNRFLIYSYVATCFLSDTAVRALDSLGLKQRLKKFFRTLKAPPSKPQKQAPAKESPVLQQIVVQEKGTPMTSERNPCQGDDVTASSESYPQVEYLAKRAKFHGLTGTIKRALSALGLGSDRPKIMQGTAKGKALRDGEVLNLKAGEIVEVKSPKEILTTLGEDGKLRGLLFMPEQLKYCGQRFKVFKRLESILLEESGELRKMKNTVILDGVLCDGWEGACDRSCFYFWREGWLRRVEDET